MKNDKYAIYQTFNKTLIAIQKLEEVKKDFASNPKPYYLDMLADVNKPEMSLNQIVKKWAEILDNDIKFKNKLCAQLKLEYKFLGLPKVHLLLD